MLLFYFYYTIHKTYDYTKTDIDEITEETTKITESNDICRDDKYECQMIETETFSPEELNKYNELFIKIKKYFIEKKPYIDAGFTMLKLASYLNSNTLYVSRAIKLNSGTNFNLFVNTYRIDFVKNMLDKGSATRYTMQYIYKSAGFKQQSTFNTVFKRIVGLTPTAYLEKNELTSNIK
jgi:AraC-like DNA-binding protein